MKQIPLMLLLLCALASRTYAQNDTVIFYLTIPDKSIISSVAHNGNTITPVFFDPEINDIIDDYEITEWRKEYPTSDYEDLRWVYRVRCNSLQLAEDLTNYNRTYFPFYVPLTTYFCYQPNDYTWGCAQKQWDYIGVTDAWTIDTGNANVVIGVTDTYFDLNHEDMQGKYAQVRSNIFTSAADEWPHGTVVAGIIAANTNNNKGMASVGYTCRVDVSTTNGHGEVLNMAQQGRRIFNGSWLTNVDSPYNPLYYAQPVYNEVYENGTFAVFAAGNARPKVEKGPNRYVYPASLDHNFSVTGVGYDDNNSTVAGTFNAKDVHEFTAGDTIGSPGTAWSHQHNDRVDLSAPSIRISTLYYHPQAPNIHYKCDDAWGTSFAAPMVAGAAGLMLSANPWLSPYQMECILKLTSRDISGNIFNQKYFSGPDRFRNSRIGAGALRAGQAVSDAADYHLDNPATSTFTIEGVDVNTLCKPGVAANGVYPVLDVKLKNGVPPYIYRWDTITGNNVTLSSLTSGSPSVIASKGNDLLYYRLTVYDGSTIQKVANRIIKLQLISDDTKYDIAMQDHYADPFDERNTMDLINPRNWSIWESPDLVVRRHNTGNSMDPEIPRYDSSNYVRVRIKNVGCTNSPEARLHLYWTMPSTGERWPQDWMGQSAPINNHPSGNTITQPSGEVISGIAPGQSQYITVEWPDVPRPQDYDTSGSLQTLEACLLARITEPNAPNLGMHNEQNNINVKENVWENNNIVTRNYVVTNFSNSLRTSKKLVIFGNASIDPGTYTLQMLTEKDINKHYAGNLSRYLTVKLYLGNLFDVWDAGGRQGNPSEIDATAKTVTYDLTKPMRLENIAMQGLERFPVFVEFNMKSGVPVPYSVTNQLVYFRQVTQYDEEIDLGDGTSMSRIRDLVHGDITFSINIAADKDAAKPSAVTALPKAKETFKLYPNPVGDKAYLVSLENEANAHNFVVSDVTGRVLLAQKTVHFTGNKYELDTKALGAGIYFVKFIDAKGISHSLKFTKTN